MLALIIGGSGSGKSEYAEELVCSMGEDRVYLATMKVSDRESEERVLRHKRLRDGRGFTTIEEPMDIGQIPLMSGSNVLLEDTGNLLANMMYDPGKKRGDQDIRISIIRDIERLNLVCKSLTIVTNDVFSGGYGGDAETERYMRNLAFTNKELAKRADLVAEVVCGFADILKEPA